MEVRTCYEHLLKKVYLTCLSRLARLCLSLYFSRCDCVCHNVRFCLRPRGNLSVFLDGPNLFLLTGSRSCSIPFVTVRKGMERNYHRISLLHSRLSMCESSHKRTFQKPFFQLVDLIAFLFWGVPTKHNMCSFYLVLPLSVMFVSLPYLFLWKLSNAYLRES